MKDHLGNIRVTIDDENNVVGYDDYYPFGLQMPERCMNNANSSDIYKFTGKERDDETGWDYFGARYYDAEIGRFLTIDRFADKYPSLTPYHYAANNPLKFIDINGDTVIFHDENAEKRHEEYYNAKYTEGKKKGQYKNKKYREQYNELHASKVNYHVKNKKNIENNNIALGGFFTDNGNDITIAVGDENVVGTLIHEFTHGVQFENSMITFSFIDEQWAANTSILNEYEAFTNQADAGFLPSPNWNRNTKEQNIKNIQNTPRYSHLPMKPYGNLPITGPKRALINAANSNNSWFYWQQKLK